MAKGDGAKELGMRQYLEALKEYEKNGNQQYQWLGDFEGGPQLGKSRMEDIITDPRYGNYQQQALRDLEQQAKGGLSAQDEADLARTAGEVNRQNAGRLGAIQQNMAARGFAGSGMELMAQQQAAQDATERQAIASLEKNAMAQNARRDATGRLGGMATQMQGQEFNQQAAKAQAADQIARFNNQNAWNQNQMNWQGRQGIANQNTAQNNQFQGNVMQARQGGAQMNYNSGVDANNQQRMERAGKGNPLQNALSGAAAGAPLGPWGIAGGAGTGLLSTFFANGGEVPGQARVPGDHPANDIVPAVLSPEEIVIPRSITQMEPNQAADAAKLFVKLTQMMNKGGRK